MKYSACTLGWFHIKKVVHQAVYCHLASLTYVQSTSCERVHLDAHDVDLSLAAMMPSRVLWDRAHSTQSLLQESIYGPPWRYKIFSL